MNFLRSSNAAPAASTILSLSILVLAMSATAVGQVVVPTKSIGKSFNPGYYAFLAGHQDIPLDVLVSPDFEGVKIKYKWRDLETAPGVYDFSEVDQHLQELKDHDKQLWLQIEYVSWNSNDEPSVPSYMWTDSSFGGGPRYYGTYERTVNEGGWYPYYWNSNLRKRLQGLIAAIGERFNNEPNFEGLSIPETAAERFIGFDCPGYEAALRETAAAANQALPNKHVFQMMNFACFDLTAYARWLSSIGIGLGTPDTYHFKDSLTDEVYPLFLQYGDTIPVGPDVQWANYERNAMPVVDIRDFAIDAMNPWYMFWRIREPYFSDEVLQAVHSRKLPRAQKFYTAGSGDRRPMPPVIDN